MSDSVRPHRRQPTRLPLPWDSPGKNTGVGCHFLLQCMKVKSESEVAQSCPTLRDPMDCSPPGSSIHGILQARVLELGCHCLHQRCSINIEKKESSVFDRTVICPLRLKKTRISVLDIHPQKYRRSDVSPKFISFTLSYSLCSIPVSLGGNIGTQHDHSQMGIIPQTPPFSPCGYITTSLI